MEERDDIIEYSLYNHHTEEEGKKKRKTIWMVTLILSIVTLVEVLLGANVKQGDTIAWHSVKMLFIILTVVKAYYIVMSFMHMGDEQRELQRIVLWTYLVFIVDIVYLIILEGYYTGLKM